MKRPREKTIYMAVFSALLLVLYLLLVLCATVPNAAILKNLRKSGRFFVNADNYAFTEDGAYQNITDNYADQIWANIGWYMGFENPFRSVLDTKYYDGEKYPVTAGLYLAVTEEQEANTSYTRYCHGTAGLIRVLHLFTDIHGIRRIGMLCLILLILRTLRDLIIRGHWDFGICLLASLLWVQVWNLRLSVEYLPSFLICFGLCPAFLRWEKRGDFFLNLLAVISGTLTAFFDFLTTETVTILLPLILVIAIRSRECRLGSPQKVMKMLLSCGICWVLAYLGTFVVKWAAVSLVTGENHFLAAMESVDQRVSGVVREGDFNRAPGMLMAIAANLTVLFEGTSRIEYRQVLVYLMAIAIMIAVVYRLYRVQQKLRPGTFFILMLGALVLLRFGFLANHSYLHSFFTYRALVSTILAVLSALAINLRPVKKGRGRSAWN